MSNEEVNIGALRELHDTVVSGDTSLFIRKPARKQTAGNPDLAKWYHPDTFAQLLCIKVAIEQMGTSLTADAAKAALLAILMPSSGLESDRPYTYYADNVKPKDPIKKMPNALFRSRLERIIAGQDALQKLSVKAEWAIETANVISMAPPTRGSLISWLHLRRILALPTM